MPDVEFRKPVRVGDVLTFWTKVTEVGTTSIHIRVELEASRDGKDDTTHVTVADVVYVAVRRGADGSIAKANLRD